MTNRTSIPKGAKSKTMNRNSSLGVGMYGADDGSVQNYAGENETRIESPLGRASSRATPLGHLAKDSSILSMTHEGGGVLNQQRRQGKKHQKFISNAQNQIAKHLEKWNFDEMMALAD